MAGRKGRSGRKPQSARAAFNAFAEEYTEQGYSRYEAWLREEHEAALNGDGTARRYLIDQYLSRAVQRSDIDLNRSLDIQLTWADGTPLPPRPGRAALPPSSGVIEGESRQLPESEPVPEAGEQEPG